MLKINFLFLLLILLTVCGCSPNAYQVGDIDRSIIGVLDSPDETNCWALVSIEWDPGVMEGMHNSYAYAGGQDDAVKVNLRRVISSAEDELFRLHSKACKTKDRLLLKITKVIHEHQIAPDTGVFYVNVSSSMFASGVCEKSGYTFSKKFESDDHSEKVGFWVSEESIERALVRMTTLSAMDILLKVRKECGNQLRD
ncbi:MAG: hypothetical protein PVG66_07845 [Chromatiales bacterium]|jgi:hypothetical protein